MKKTNGSSPSMATDGKSRWPGLTAKLGAGIVAGSMLGLLCTTVSYAQTGGVLLDMTVACRR
jgi:hypothetical protein